VESTHNVRAAFYAQDRNVLAFLGQLNNQLGVVSRTSGRANQGFMQTNKYMQALSITMRYAFAGEVIQQIRMAYQNLKLFQKGLADVTAVGTQTNGLPLLQSQLDGLGQSALRTSTQTATAVADILDTYRSIYSSIPNASIKTVERLGTLATKGAAISETDPRTFIQSIIGMKNAFGLQMRDMNRISAEFFTVIRRSINMSGDEWAHYSGRIVAASRMANISLEQMNELMIAMTRSGGTAAVNVRHLTQFLMRARFPTKSAQASYAQIGLTPDVLSHTSAITVFTRIMEHAARLSGAKVPSLPDNFNSLNPTQQAQVIQRTARRSQKALEGPGLQFIHQSIGGRMESTRAFISLVTQLQNTTGDIKELNSKNQVERFNSAFDRFLDQKPLESMSIAMQNFTTGLLQEANPLFRLLARATRGASLGIQTGVHAGSRALGAADRGINSAARTALNALGIPIGGNTAQRFHVGSDTALIAAIAGGAFAGKGLGKLLRKVPFGKAAGGGATGLLEAEAVTSALAGNATGSYTAPLWVVIHPLSYRFGNLGRSGVTDPTGSSGKGKGLFDRLKGLGKRVVPIFRPPSIGGLASSAGGAAAAAVSLFGAEMPALPDIFRELGPKHLDPATGKPLHWSWAKFFTLRDMPTEDMFKQRQRAQELAHQASKGAGLVGRQISRVSGQNLQGNIKATIVIEPDKQLQNLIKPKTKVVHIPTSLWQVGSPPPLMRGRPTDKRH